MEAKQTETRSSSSKVSLICLIIVATGATAVYGSIANDAVDTLPRWYRSWGSNVQSGSILLAFLLSLIGATLHDRPGRIALPLMLVFLSIGILTNISFGGVMFPEGDIPAVCNSIGAVASLLASIMAVLAGVQAIAVKSGKTGEESFRND